MIPSDNPRENKGKTVLRVAGNGRSHPKERISWNIGIIYGLLTVNDSTLDYKIRDIYEGRSSTVNFTPITDKELFLVNPINIKSKENREKLREELGNSPDFSTLWGSRDRYIEDIIAQLDNIRKDYKKP
ncbi:hypothetical protein KY366_05310 [Candidatus Woesearchaeota archaeon]|nr:hypothetical protein [Candidatus Woesearchaeota archaeon]